MKGPPWTAEEDDHLRNLALSGFSLAEIALRMLRGKSSVRNRALKMKVPIARDRNPMQAPQKSPGGFSGSH
jgi:hypothetical protein